MKNIIAGFLTLSLLSVPSASLAQLAAAMPSGIIPSVAPVVGQGTAVIATNAVTAKGLSAQCSANQLACIMAGLSIAQMATSLISTKSSAAAAKSVLSPAEYASTDFGNGLTGAGVDKAIGYGEGALASATDTLKKNAPYIDPAAGTVKTSKGTVPLSSLSSGKAIVDAGFADQSQIGAIDAQLKKMDAFKMPVLNASAGGGGGGSSARSASEKYEMPNFNFGEKENPRAPATAGLVKLANGEPIGTASDNIFNMLHNRYQKKVAEKMFVGQEQSR